MLLQACAAALLHWQPMCATRPAPYTPSQKFAKATGSAARFTDCVSCMHQSWQVSCELLLLQGGWGAALCCGRVFWLTTKRQTVHVCCATCMLSRVVGIAAAAAKESTRVHRVAALPFVHIIAWLRKMQL